MYIPLQLSFETVHNRVAWFLTWYTLLWHADVINDHGLPSRKFDDLQGVYLCHVPQLQEPKLLPVPVALQDSAYCSVPPDIVKLMIYTP